MDIVRLDKLYKYQSVNLYSISNLINSVIYLLMRLNKFYDLMGVYNDKELYETYMYL